VTSFDELIGAEPAGEERARLRSVHELLLEAGPPPEISPEIAKGPSLKMTLGRGRRAQSSRRRLIPLVAAAALVAAIIGIGLSINNKQQGLVVPLRGTIAAPKAAGTLDVLRPRTMRIHVTGLAQGTYGVYVVSNGRPSLECGSFVVKTNGIDTAATLTSPYRLHAHDTWVVARQRAGGAPGVTVLRPPTAKT
jgi:hypothetical protein